MVEEIVDSKKIYEHGGLILGKLDACNKNCLDLSINSFTDFNINIDGSKTNNNYSVGYYEYCDYFTPFVQQWYPQYYPIWYNYPNKMESAFKIVQKLIDKKIIKDNITVKIFIELVTEISQIL